MRVKALIAFSARVNGKPYAISEGAEFELPAGVNWLNEGLVEALTTKRAPARKKKTSAQATKRETR